MLSGTEIFKFFVSDRLKCKPDDHVTNGIPEAIVRASFISNGANKTWQQSSQFLRMVLLS